MIAIYKITNRLNGKPYVGQTRQPIEKRFLQHAKAHTPTNANVFGFVSSTAKFRTATIFQTAAGKAMWNVK
ncbi:MAG: GIY-YIG nuclease family protein [Selenomonadaceae bacterium]|nr:GIY-YIG nuclease family protein [Selenomonadaceae bacterium]